MEAKIAISTCERLMTAATSHCGQTTIATPPAIIATHEPNWEAVTTGLTSMSTAFSWGLVVLAVIGLLGLIGFGIFVRGWAKEEARKVAQDWFDTEAPEILKQLNAPLNPPGGNIPPSAPDDGANDIANAAG